MAARTALAAPHPPPLAVTMKTVIVSAADAAAFSVDAALVSSATETPLIEITANAAIIAFVYIL